ncbi:MAG: PKD domain-containing protein [Saprospiraceae bacterium]|nr:PKD domain-containing protein [Saprospiraceae bacterium]
MKKFTFLAFFLLFAVALSADTEPNNNQGQANPIMLGQKISGTMTGTDSEDWYVIDLPAGGSFKLNVTKHGDASFMIQIWDGILPNTIISALFMPFTVNPLDMDQLVKQLGPGRYYIRLLRNTSVGFYEIEAQVIPPAFGNDPEMNESFETAIEIPLDGSVSGTFGYYHSGTGHDKADWYTYTQDKAGTVEFTINKVGPGAANLTNQDSSSSNKIILNNLFMPQNMNSPPEGWVMETHALQGTYFVGITDFNNAPLDYKITTKFIPPKWNEDREPNDLRVNLDTFPANVRIEGLLGYHKAGKGKDVADNYYLEVKKPSILSLNLLIDRIGSGNIRLKSNDHLLKSEFFNETNIDKALKVNQTVEPGIYLLELEYASGVFGYQVDVDKLEAPEADFKFKKSNNTLAFENLTNAEQANHTWNFDDGSPTVNTVNPIHTYATPGVYNVCLKSVNPAGTSEMCKKISIEGVSRIHPKEGGNTGDVTMHINGGGFDNDFKVRLIKNGTVIKEVNAILKNSGTLAANFDLRGTEEGPVDVEIAKPGGPNYRIQNGFNIAKGSKPDTWARLTGRNRILKNTFTTYNVEVGNNGNVDATVVPFYIMVKNTNDIELEIEQSLFFNIEDDGNEESGPEYTIVNIKTDNQNSYRVYSFLIPLIRPGGTESFKIKIKSTEDVDVVVWTEKAWYQSPVNENKLNCIKDNYLENLEFINTLFDEKITEPQLECFFFTFTEELDKIKLINNSGDNLTHSRFIVNYLKSIGTTLNKCGIKDNEFRNVLIQLAMDYILNLAVRDGIPSKRNICEAEFESENMQTNQITAVSSFDPNEKSGYLGWGENNYHADLQNIPYTIYFENQSNATAPAHVVSITDT